MAYHSHGGSSGLRPHNAGYRKAALEHHPDKAGAAAADEARKAAIEEHFKAIQEAYETLSDPARRREFDSVDDFDDTLPVDCAPADFLKVPSWVLSMRGGVWVPWQRSVAGAEFAATSPTR